MRLYTNQHKFYCGIDLHARSVYICLLDQKGKTVLHRNYKASPEAFPKVINPHRKDIAVAPECMFVWYWLADVCAREKIAFVLGRALYMKAIHGGKSKNDRIDSKEVALLSIAPMITWCSAPAACIRDSGGMRPFNKKNKIFKDLPKALLQ
jgi:hypothetical protein